MRRFYRKRRYYKRYKYNNYYKYNKFRYSNNASNYDKNDNIGIFVVLTFLAIGLITPLSNFIFEFIKKYYLILIILVACILIAVLIIIGIKQTNKRYKKLVEKYNLSIQALKTLNSKYQFEEVSDITYTNNYDNKKMFESINPVDYYTYMLTFVRNDISNTILIINRNKELYNEYLKDVNNIKSLNKFSFKKYPLFKKKLLKLTGDIFKETMLKPTIKFNSCVTLFLVNLNGKVKDVKSECFDLSQTKALFEKLDNKTYDYYNDESIWKSLSIVERGKVTNKIRFAIYERDNNRCCYCGSRSNLEIDHIIPISKGGKTILDNLQTLCHKCNVEKSNSLPKNIFEKIYKIEGQNCPNYTTGKIVLKHGKNTEFYGCSNYPRCKYIKFIN